jgi:hypothetical protein
MKPSPEVRALIREFCKIQEAKYGPDWKKKLAAEMAEQSRPFLAALLQNRQGTRQGEVPQKYPEHGNTGDNSDTGGTKNPREII